tara:strand:+ start:106 stop:270 length:165 start_codon:yes stop_codon:yes gene_type:complete
MYFTDCTRHLWLLPSGTEHPGQGKVVLSLSTNGVPEDAHTVALPLAPVIDLLAY